MSLDSKIASYTGSRSDVVGLADGIPERVLDLGCSDGSLALGFKEQGSLVWGVELDPEFATVAESRLDTVICGDVLEAVDRFVDDGTTFDLVVCADILEHLVDPVAVLRGVKGLLAVDGQVLVSLPNVRFYTTLTSLVFSGRWRRLDRGVHDRTHLRWFTDLDARDLFKESGFEVEKQITHYRLKDSPVSRANRFAKSIARGPIRGFLAYQLVYRLRHAS